MITKAKTDWNSVTIYFTDGEIKCYSFKEWTDYARAQIEKQYHVYIPIA